MSGNNIETLLQAFWGCTPIAFWFPCRAERTFPLSSTEFAFRPKEVHDREDAIANTRDACAPQMRDHRSRLQQITDHFSPITSHRSLGIRVSAPAWDEPLA
jgi:hypothetical protein